METFTLPPADTILMLARQGHAAQYRRRRPALRYSAHSRVSECLSSSEETVLGDTVPAFSDSIRNTSRFEGLVRPLSLPATAVGPGVAHVRDSAYSQECELSPCSTLLPSSCPPSARYQLHEQFSAQLKNGAIEEADGEDGMVIYNGLRRLSLPEAGLVIQGRPRIVHI